MDTEVHPAPRTVGSPLADPALPAYMPQLDALRAVAVLAVWFEHWGPEQKVKWGLLGVRLFFVLSGFLITGILLRARDQVAGSSGGLGQAIRNFYARRFLRILPIYYLALFVVTALAWVGFLRGTALLPMFKWHVTYLTNVYAATHNFPANSGLHFWSLAVEEQFYLVWPWLVLLTPRRHVGKMITATVVLAVVFRGFCAIRGMRPELGMLPFGCIDQFALGAALALMGHEPALRRWWKPFSRICLDVGLPFATVLLVLSARKVGGAFTQTFSGLTQAMVFTSMIAGAARGFGMPFRAILQTPPLLFLGRISYGLYVYHPFVALILMTAAARIGHPLPSNWGIRFAIYGVGTLLVATASWFLIERPIAGLKRRFEYAPPAA